MKIKNTWLAIVLAVAMLLGIVAQAFAANNYTTPSFTDVKKSDWFYTYVEQVAEKGWISGYDDGTFGPNKPVTYAEFTTMLMNAFLPYALEWKIEHLNIGNSPWYLPYCVSAADGYMYDNTSVQKSITTKNVDPTAASQPVTRTDMAVMINNMLHATLSAYMPGEAELEEAARNTPDVEFSYHSTSGDFASLYIMEIKALGILSGVDDKGTFAGDQTMTRAQAAVVLTKIEEVCNKQSLVDPFNPNRTGNTNSTTNPGTTGPGTTGGTSNPGNTSNPGGTDTTTTPEQFTTPSYGGKDANGYTLASSVNSAKPKVGKSDTYKTKGRATTANKNGYFTAANVDIGNAQLVYELLSLVNEARAKEGLAPVQWTYLDSAEEYTLLRAKELTKKFSHERPDNQYDCLTEIVGFVPGNYEAAFAAWMASAGHRAVIMREGDARVMCAAQCNNYWIITFGTAGKPGDVEFASEINYTAYNGFMENDF